MIDGGLTFIKGLVAAGAGVLTSELGVGILQACYDGAEMSLGAIKMYASWNCQDCYVTGGVFECISFDRGGNGSNGQHIDLIIGIPTEIKEVPFFINDFNGFLDNTNPPIVNSPDFTPLAEPRNNTNFYFLPYGINF